MASPSIRLQIDIILIPLMYYSTHFSMFHSLRLYSLAYVILLVYVSPLGLEWHCVDSLCLLTSSFVLFIFSITIIIFMLLVLFSLFGLCYLPFLLLAHLFYIALSFCFFDILFFF